MTDHAPSHAATRRQVLAGAGALVGSAAMPLPAAAQLSVQVQRPANLAGLALAIRKFAGDAEIKPGKVKLDMPPLSENGNSVTMSVTVDSPMTKTEYVKAIHVFNERNPQPYVISVWLGPRAGKAAIQTRIRLADTQTITAIAELSDGTFWSGKADVVVTLGACLEDPV